MCRAKHRARQRTVGEAIPTKLEGPPGPREAISHRFLGYAGHMLTCVLCPARLGSWEPPLAELADSILEAFTAEQRRNLFIAPIDWESNQQQGDHLIQPAVAHTLEWRRFCANGLGCTHLALFEAKA